MSIYSQVADYLQYISPEFYKRRFFKKLHGLSHENILDRKVEPEMLWLKHTLKKDAVFFDIGANVGAYIYLIENKLEPHNIYAFEPNLDLFLRLKRIFPKIKVSDIALSDENTTAEFKIPVMDGRSVHSRGTLQINNRESGESGAKMQQVKVMPLDEWSSINQISRIDFIKIDVEGNELQTLRGAEQTVRRFHPVLMVEIEQRHHDFPVWDIIEEVKNWGYSAHYLDRKTFSPKILTRAFLESQNADNVKVYDSYINNIIFLPN